MSVPLSALPVLILLFGAVQGCDAGQIIPVTLNESVRPDAQRDADAPPPPNAAPDLDTLEAWANACQVLAAGDDEAHAEGAQQALADRARENNARCQDYQVYLASTPGIWGDTTLLTMLGLMKGVQVAAYEMRAGAPAPSPDPAAEPQPRQPPRVEFAEWLGAAESDVKAHLVNLGRLHWQTFLPSAVVDAGARNGTPVEGTLLEAGGSGDCMYYAFLASMHAQTEASAPSHTYVRDAPRMLALRRELGQFIRQHWDTPIADLGADIDATSTLGELSYFGEPRDPDPLGSQKKRLRRH